MTINLKNPTNFLFLLLLLCSCAPKPDLIWKAKTGGAIYPSPGIAANKVIIGSNDHNLYAFDIATGDVSWKTDLGDRILMPPHVEGQNIYIGNAAGYLFQVKAEDGSTGWRFDTKGTLQFTVCSDDEGMYVGSEGGGFYKLDRSGKMLWKFQTRQKLTSSCLFYKDLVLTTSWDTNLYALKRDTGELVWKYSTGKLNYGNGIIVGDSYYYATHNAMYKFDPSSGKLLYKKKIDYNTFLLPYGNFLITQENGLTKRSLDGDFLGNLKFRSFAEFAPVQVENTILSADTTNSLVGISPDLKMKWKFRAGQLFWSPGVFYNGSYYIGNRDGHVYALKLPS